MSQLPISLPVPVTETATTRGLVRRFAKNLTGMVSLAFLVIIVLVAAAAPLLTSYDPNSASVKDVLVPPGGAHLLGTDSAGRDIWARLLYGARFTLAGALLAAAVAAALGITSGLIAGYYGRWFNTVASWIASFLMALPGIVVLLAARSVLGGSLWVSMLIFGILLTPAFFRLVYAAVGAVRSELYVDAARVSGVSDLRIIGRHLLTVVRAPIVIQASIVISIAIAIQAGLDFLGFGDPSVPTWGNILNDAFSALYTNPNLLLWPSIAIALTCVALTLFANALRDELERTARPQRQRRPTSPATTQVRPAPITHVATTPAAKNVLQIEGLGVGYRQAGGDVKEVVDDVSLRVARGEIHGLIGESGSGKTQTAWSVLGLLPPGGEILRGSIMLGEHDLTRLREPAMAKLRGRRIGYIPQEPMSNLDPSFTIGSQLVEPMRKALHLSKKEARLRALDLLERVGIPEPGRVYASYAHEVSGGMAQRVLIAGAVSCQPDLLIADEPTTALDVTVQAEILDLIREVQQEFDMSVLLVTHNFGVVADLCDQVSVMQSGLIVENGPVRSLFADPQHPYTRSLFDAILDENGPARSRLVPLQGSQQRDESATQELSRSESRS